MACNKFFCFGCTQPLDNSQLQWCSGCKQAYYCARTCQKTHWKEHKLICSQNRQSPSTPINLITTLLKQCPSTIIKLSAIKQYLITKNLADDLNYFSLIQIPSTTTIFHEILKLLPTTLLYYVTIDYTSMINVPSFSLDIMSVGLVNTQNSTMSVATTFSPTLSPALLQLHINSVFGNPSRLLSFLQQSLADPNHFLIMCPERDDILLVSLKHAPTISTV